MSSKKQSLHFQDISDQIERFEREHMDWLKQQDLLGWNLWFLLRKPLFYAFKHRHYKLKKSERKKPGKLNSLITALPVFGKLLYFLITVKKADAVISTDVNRSENENGMLKDKFFGPLFDTGIISRAVYFENNQNKSNKGIRRHINTAKFNIVSGLLWRHYSKKSIFREKAALFTEKFNSSVPDHQPGLLASEKMILELITYFYAEFRIYKFIWKYFRPQRVFIADGIPRGATAASLHYGIPVFEFQHGFISDKKSDYIVPGPLKSAKSSMVVPGRILVFGHYFRDLLLRSGFWNENEVGVLGSYPLDKARKTCSFQVPEENERIRVVWATQPTTFADARRVLEELAAMNLTSAVFHFRLHPLEPAKQKKWYEELAADHPGLFEMTPTGLNFFESLKNKHLLISFHSTVLLEAIALGYPVLSVATAKYQNGINDLVITDVSGSVRPVSGAAEIAGIINRFMNDPAYVQEWTRICREQGNYFFDENYQSNLRTAFH